MKNKKIYKAIACVSVWLTVVIACIGFACFKSSKVKAGVILDENLVLQGSGANYYIEKSNITDAYFVGFDYATFSGSVNVGAICINSATSYAHNKTLWHIFCTGIRGDIPNKMLLQVYCSKASGFSAIGLVGNDYANTTSSWVEGYAATTQSGETFYAVNINEMITRIKQASTNNNDLLENYSYRIFSPSSSNAIFKKSISINAVDNIYDLQQGDAAIIYISDVSGFNSSSYIPEITINWGYIDSSDNTVYAVYSPTVNVMKAPGDLEIWLNIPTDASGTVYDSVILNQQALLTTITEGGATANANIYALYVWLLSDRIQWGLLNFNTAGLPASAQSMNYFTSYTTKYDYINTNTGTMTCRLSISNNFNFITIKNQPVFSVNTINTTLRQGGLLPAWALYNWARGSAAGYTSGTQAGAAPYQPGNTGYNEIFQAGYNAGLTAQPAAAWYEAAFTAVDDFLNIHIFPNITFGELFGIPFVISVVWFIIRMFRGGGSSG